MPTCQQCGGSGRLGWDERGAQHPGSSARAVRFVRMELCPACQGWGSTAKDEGQLATAAALELISATLERLEKLVQQAAGFSESDRVVLANAHEEAKDAAAHASSCLDEVRALGKWTHAISRIENNLSTLANLVKELLEKGGNRGD